MNPLESTLKELEQAGIAYVLEHGKRHYKVRFVVRGENCIVVVSGNSKTSDHRAALNARLTVRRIIRRALGMEK